ncbi:MAG: hypothetical protein AAGJ10_06565 [Bacteroidota bacterium]
MRTLLAILTACVLFIGCDSVAVDDEGVVLRIQDDALVARNATGEAIYYTVFGENIAAVIDWAPIISDENRIDPRRAVTIPLDDIAMRGDEEKLLFYWWRPNRDGTGADRIRSLVISL